MTVTAPPMNILFLESFYGGSHKLFADGCISSLPHSFTLSTLPDTSWKKRLKGSAFHFYSIHRSSISTYDAVITTSMMNTGDFKLLCGSRTPPVILYMHENQLTYPRTKAVRRDFHIESIHLSSCIAASRIIFNSYYHRKAFLNALAGIIPLEKEDSKIPVIEAILAKSAVIYPGITFPAQPPQGLAPSDPPVIVWNHRWEYDKQPNIFFQVLKNLKERGVSFRLILLGEPSKRKNSEFAKARDTFSNEILHFGYARDRGAYFSLLSAGDIIISTSIQENFGISVVEGMYAGLYPLLPERLSYPELIPDEFHNDILYSDTADLTEKLSSLCRGGIRKERARRIRLILAEKAKTYSWEYLKKSYNTILNEAVRNGR